MISNGTAPVDDFGFDPDFGLKQSSNADPPLLELNFLEPILKSLGNPQVMGNLEALLQQSWKFVRLADDMHDIRGYLNDMRICFIALTVSGYVGILIYALIMVCRRRRAATDRNRSPDFSGKGMEEGGEWGDELQSVKTERTYAPDYDSNNYHSSPYRGGGGGKGRNKAGLPRHNFYTSMDAKGELDGKQHMTNHLVESNGSTTPTGVGGVGVVPTLVKDGYVPNEKV